MTRRTVPSPPTIPDSEIQDFADMSAALTGFQSSVLKPALDPLGLSRIYYEFALTQVGSAMTTLLNAYRAIKTQPAQQIADTLLETSSSSPSTQAQLAQSIVAMWYLGSWYVPGVLGGGGFAPPPLQVISSVAYTNGLVWRVMQSHPMGYSAFTFGYWSQQPGSLSSFGVNTGNGGGQ
jgi:Membrane bound FAD containing D-sorbitol dehydrogenase